MAGFIGGGGGGLKVPDSTKCYDIFSKISSFFTLKNPNRMPPNIVLFNIKEFSHLCVCVWGGGGGGGGGEGDILPNNPNIPLEDAGGIRPHIIAPPQMHFLDPPLILYH